MLTLPRRHQERESRRTTLGRKASDHVRLPSGGRLVTTGDTLVEGVHFDLSYTNAREVAHKALAVALADVAAMGATPLHAHIAVGVRQDTSEAFLLEMRAELEQLARRMKMSLQFTSGILSPTALLVTTSVISHVKRDLMTYAGARPGDWLVVTGSLGQSAAGLNCLRTLGRGTLTLHDEIVRAHLLPHPRIREARELIATGGVRALIELSDGLASEVHLLTEASRTGALIDETSLPLSEATRRGAELLNTSPRTWTLYGAEDFELLAAIAPKSLDRVKAAMKRLRCPIHVIGQILPRKAGVHLKTHAGEIVPFQARLWHPFVRRRRRAA